MPDRAKQQRIKQVFQKLRQNEVFGIHVTHSMHQSQTIHEGALPDEYSEEPHVVQCMNHLNSNRVPDFDPFNSNLDGTISQLTNINTQISEDEGEDEDDVFAFAADNIKTSIENDKKIYELLFSIKTKLHGG